MLRGWFWQTHEWSAKKNLSHWNHHTIREGNVTSFSSPDMKDHAN